MLSYLNRHVIDQTIDGMLHFYFREKTNTRYTAQTVQTCTVLLIFDIICKFCHYTFWLIYWCLTQHTFSYFVAASFISGETAAYIYPDKSPNCHKLLTYSMFLVNIPIECIGGIQFP